MKASLHGFLIFFEFKRLVFSIWISSDTRQSNVQGHRNFLWFLFFDSRALLVNSKIFLLQGICFCKPAEERQTLGRFLWRLLLLLVEQRQFQGTDHGVCELIMNRWRHRKRGGRRRWRWWWWWWRWRGDRRWRFEPFDEGWRLKAKIHISYMVVPYAHLLRDSLKSLLRLVYIQNFCGKACTYGWFMKGGLVCLLGTFFPLGLHLVTERKRD